MILSKWIVRLGTGFAEKNPNTLLASIASQRETVNESTDNHRPAVLVIESRIVRLQFECLAALYGVPVGPRNPTSALSNRTG